MNIYIVVGNYSTFFDKCALLNYNVIQRIFELRFNLKKLLVLLLVSIVAMSVFTPVAFAETPQGEVTSDRSSRYRVTYKDGYAYAIGGYFGMSGIEVTTMIRDSSLKAGVENETVEKLFAEVDVLMATLDAVSDTQTVGSDINKFNYSNPGSVIEIHKYTYEMLNIAHKMYEVTEGAFNPAVYRLVDLWGFSSRTYHINGDLPYDRQWDGFSYPLPEQKYIDAFLKLTDFSKVNVYEQDGKYYVEKNCPSVTVDGVEYTQWIDLGGIAKGYGADLAKEIITKYGFDKGYVNVGTSSFTFLKYTDDEAWDLGLQNPFLGQASYANLPVENVMVSTSGQYNRRYTTDGVEYSHIIDGTTGRPAQTGIVTITTIGGSAAEDDCLTTALTVMGLDKAVEFINGDYFAENKLETSLVYDGGGETKHMITNIPTEKFTAYGTDQIALSSEIIDGKVHVNFNTIKPQGDKQAVVGIVTSVAVIFLIVAVTLTIRSNNKTTALQRVNSVAKSKTFKLADVVVYGVLAVTIVVLFVVFVFTDATTNTLEKFYITDDTTGKVIYTFDFASFFDSDYLGVVNESWDNGTVTVTRMNDTVYVTVKRNDMEGDHYNMIVAKQLENKDGSKYFEVTVNEANCSGYPDCVHSFFPITTSNRTIVCLPHHITVVGYNSNGSDSVVII